MALDGWDDWKGPSFVRSQCGRLGKLQRQIGSGALAYCYSLGYAAPCHVLTATQVLYLQTFLNCVMFSDDEKLL